MSFAVWLKKRAANDAGARTLQEFAAAHAADWPYESDSLGDYVRAALPHTTPADRDQIVQLLGAQFQAFISQGSRKRGFWEFVSSNISGLLLILFGLMVGAAILFSLFGKPAYLTAFARPENARSLITFLFAVTTIAIILMVAVATLWMEKSEVEARFGSAKDLITILIGVLGTILGFYFGSATSDASRSMFLANVSAPSEQLAPGSAAEISGVIVGGTGPYTYDIVFSDPAGSVAAAAMTQKGTTSDGGIKVPVPITTVSKEGAVTFTITARDANGTAASSVGTLFVRPAPIVPAGTAAPQ